MGGVERGGSGGCGGCGGACTESTHTATAAATAQPPQEGCAQRAQKAVPRRLLGCAVMRDVCVLCVGRGSLLGGVGGAGAGPRSPATPPRRAATSEHHAFAAGMVAGWRRGSLSLCAVSGPPT